MTITSKQRAYLISLAVDSAVTVQVGKDGVTPKTVESVNEVFNTHELVKGTVLKTSPDEPSEAAGKIAERTRSTLIKVIGRKFILYKPDKDKPKIELPR